MKIVTMQDHLIMLFQGVQLGHAKGYFTHTHSQAFRSRMQLWA